MKRILHAGLTLLLASLPALHGADAAGQSLRMISREVTKTRPPFHGAVYADANSRRLVNKAQASDDNGTTWTPNPFTPDFARGLPYGYRREPVTAMLDPHGGRVLVMFNALDTPGLDPRANEPLEALSQYYLRYRVSTDGGRTWLFDEPVIQQGGYDARHPVQDVWIGQDGIFLGDSGCTPLTTRAGTVLVPTEITLRGENGKLANPGGSFTYTDAAVLIGAWTADHHLQWRVSPRVQGDPARSSRGMIEPTLAETGDGRLLMVMRGSNDTLKPDPVTNEKPPGFKWFSLSSDGGFTWSSRSRGPTTMARPSPRRAACLPSSGTAPAATSGWAICSRRIRKAIRRAIPSSSAKWTARPCA
jgi:hypothetical protein